MYARIAAFFAWGLAAACAVYWALRLLAAPAGLPASAQPVAMAGELKGDIGRLFAAAPVVTASPAAARPELSGRFKLIGVMAPKEGERGRGQGIALIAVDGKPPRPYRVGAFLEGALVLQSVASRSATLGPEGGGAAVKLDMPVLAAPATGVRPPLPGLNQPLGATGGAPSIPQAPSGQPTNERPAPASQPEATAVPLDSMPPDLGASQR